MIMIMIMNMITIHLPCQAMSTDLTFPPLFPNMLGGETLKCHNSVVA